MGLALTLLLGACAASSQTAEGEPQEGETPKLRAGVDDVQMRCRRVKVTGSRLKKRVCTKASTREAEEDAARQFINPYRTTPAGN